MRKIFISIAVLFGGVFIACTNPAKSNKETASVGDVNKTEHKMKNLVSIVEIPVTDFSKAVTFYQAVLDIVIEEVDMGGTQMGVIPNDVGTVNVVLVKGSDYIPTTEGVVIYLNAGKDLQPMLEKVEKNGGKVIVPKTEISPEMGFFALFIDTEGNKLGLHSSN